MILKRDLLKVDYSFVRFLYTAGDCVDGTRFIQSGLDTTECDRMARSRIAAKGVSVSQIIAAELCTEEKLLVALAETQDKLARLVSAVEGFVGYPEDPANPKDRVLETPDSFCRVGHTEEEKAEYTALYNAALDAAGVCCDVEPLLSRVVLHPSTAGSMYVFLDAPEGGKVGEDNG